jgi:hypothetical protein
MYVKWSWTNLIHHLRKRQNLNFQSLEKQSPPTKVQVLILDEDWLSLIITPSLQSVLSPKKRIVSGIPLRGARLARLICSGVGICA